MECFERATRGRVVRSSVQWADNGQPVAGGALYRQFHRQFFGCSRPAVWRSRCVLLGVSRTDRSPLFFSALLSAFLVRLRCHSTMLLMVNRLLEPVYARPWRSSNLSLGNAVRCWDHLDMISKCGVGGFGRRRSWWSRKEMLFMDFLLRMYFLKKYVALSVQANNNFLILIEIDLDIGILGNKTFTNFLFLSYCAT